MVSVCPQPCSRLATAVIFIIVGVIQLLVGVILLRSEYANLLSGPDFLTASTNIGTGCIYGITASIWNINNSFSTKNNARKNVLAALLVSVITINTTAVIVLLMGDGKKLLILHLENNKSETVDFASEILAYAYIASVCSPISCIVVAIVALSGRCFEACREETTEKLEDSMKDDSYNWVFDSKDGSLKVINDLARTTSVSYSLSTSKDNILSKKGNIDRRKSVLSLKNIQSPLNMWRQKREKMLWDVKASQKQAVFDSSLKNPKLGGSLPEKLIPRIKQTSLIKKQDNLNKSKSIYFNDSDHSEMCKSILKRSSSGPDPRKMVFEDKRPFHNYNLGVPDTIEGFFGKSTDLLKDNLENCEYNIKNKRKKVPERLKNITSTSACGHRIDKRTKVNKRCPNHDEEGEDDIYPFDPVVSELKAEALKELKQKIEKILPGTSIAIINLSDSSKEGIKPLLDRGNKPRFSVRNSSDSSDVFQDETEADISRNKISSDRPLSSEESSPSAHRPTRYSESSYHDSAFKNRVMDPGLTVISKIRSNSLDLSRDEPDIKKKCQYKDETSASSSSMTAVRGKNISNPLSSPKTRSIKQKDKKCNSSRKVSSMASIAEVPLEEQVNIDYEHDSAFCTPVFDNSRNVDENSNIRNKMSPSSKRITSLKNARRKSSISSNNLLKRMWSSSATECKMNVADLIMDEDSLIGLSEEELIARTLRIRSLRKSVEERLKKKEKQVNNYREHPVYL
ncbi:uncharacterized protein TNCT_185481 [Trichonephila clavata]|uniref:Uncharacterized protein n=1 Tax=Trichonephila clavata TaxID=2740835 RepID=A0A8X6IP59_TRICU|nr:uncharacterized protein TNCT_185481 [Trichonephila clavata]